MVARARARTRAGTRLAAARTEQVVEEVLLGPNNAGRLVRRRVGEAGRGARRAANQPVPAQREEWRQKRGRGGGAQAARTESARAPKQNDGEAARRRRRHAQVGALLVALGGVHRVALRALGLEDLGTLLGRLPGRVWVESQARGWGARVRGRGE